MANTKEFSEIVAFGIDLGEAIAKSLEDDKFDFSDVFNILPALMGARDAIIGAKNAVDELKDLDDSEYQALVASFRDRFDIADDDAESKIEAGYQAALKIAQLVAMFVRPKPTENKEPAEPAKEEKPQPVKPILEKA